MKLFVVLSALIVAINASADHAAWQNFKLTHSKSYHVREEQLRFQVFQNNLRKIEEHNAKYENGEVSYYLAVNQFADMTPEEFAAMLNQQIASKPKLNTTLHETDPTLEVDEEVDWRDKAVLAVKRQGECGSCWAFSTTGALEGQLAIKRNSKIPLSQQELVDCSKKNAGCLGGNMELAFEYIKENGLSSEEDYPYTEQDGTCKKVARTVKSISGFKSVDHNEKALKEAVATVGPISVAVNANLEWQLYGGGVFDHLLCLGLTLNHGVVAVGYGHEGKDYWLIKNSWGAAWGEKGYIRLVRGKNQCGIANDASYPVL